MKKILIVDDEPEVCLSLCEILASKGYEGDYETDPLKVLEKLKVTVPDLILLDVRMPEIGGMDLLRKVKANFETVPVIMISGHASVQHAVKAMKYGAVNFFTKPLEIPDLLAELDSLLSQSKDATYGGAAETLIYESREMDRLLALIRKVAPTDATVLITGESGTGKEITANLIHNLSPRAKNPFVKINCAAIPESLLETELFGHEQWAFTDAKIQKKGLFEASHKGSMFLDEIGDMSVGIQAKMLRVLQDKQYMRVGGVNPVATDTRIIAATNQDLEEAIASSAFRGDLYYRLSVVRLHIPALRERRGDILPLAEHYLNLFSRQYGKISMRFSDDVRRFFFGHCWPGNVRELKNCVERMVIFASTDGLSVEDLPEQYKQTPNGICEEDFRGLYQDSGRDVLIQALEKAGGVKNEAAKLLKITRKTLYNRMKKHNIPGRDADEETD